jgi:sulfide dehydrogenase cytochrome subunit
MRLHCIVRATLACGFAAGMATLTFGADEPASLGRDIAANCANCHGTGGRSLGGIPSIAGLDQAYLVQQMRDFRDGKRPSTVMQQLARGYSDAQIEAAAAYLSVQKPN